MAAMVEFEEKLYCRKGLVTYMADRLPAGHFHRHDGAFADVHAAEVPHG